MIPELAHRAAPHPAPSAGSRLETTELRSTRSREAARGLARPDSELGPGGPAEDPGADFALSLSSASLRLAAGASSPGATGWAATSAVTSAATSAAPVVDPVDSPAFSSVAAAPAAAPEAAPRGAAGRAIAAYREIARAPVGERVRIVV
ncbi:MAG: hypothetical protein U0900_11565 [Myxococcota bacterium]